MRNPLDVPVFSPTGPIRPRPSLGVHRRFHHNRSRALWRLLDPVGAGFEVRDGLAIGAQPPSVLVEKR